MTRMAVFACACFSLSWLIVGCSDQYAGRYALSGKVTVKGEPLKDGTIQFESIDKSLGQLTGAPIKDGVFEIKRMNGLKPGKYRVKISCGDGKTPPNVEEAGNPGGSTNIISFDLIPPEFGSRSTQEVEVKDSGSNEFTFDIPKFMTPPKKR